MKRYLIEDLKNIEQIDLPKNYHKELMEKLSKPKKSFKRVIQYGSIAAAVAIVFAIFGQIGDEQTMAPAPTATGGSIMEDIEARIEPMIEQYWISEQLIFDEGDVFGVENAGEILIEVAETITIGATEIPVLMNNETLQEMTYGGVFYLQKSYGEGWETIYRGEKPLTPISSGEIKNVVFDLPTPLYEEGLYKLIITVESAGGLQFHIEKYFQI